ncbi:hypothetical protein LL033_24380 (plasmid) [Clostridium estertheticum]|uniref:hypothetical protein n=1 Tax=Clostridium estertheticum TaxID=238834 RepID=UPI001C0E408B|nr:hypothetical protein [Clostridium estertheticum]MBU3217753.1 hypothetical protein [Clostridium estertheticum]WAG58271.1 hypothetical protein LL033_24380 [Clostridium estertheticum]
MKLNNYIYSLTNLNVSNKFKNQNLIKSNRNTTSMNLNKSISQNIVDRISFGAGKQFALNRELLSSITKVNGQDVTKLTASNNVLDFKQGSYYKVQTSSGLTAILTAGNGGGVHMPTTEFNLGENFSLAPSDWKDLDKTEKLFTYLGRDKSGYCAYSNYSNTEIKDMLGSVGIKPGFFEIKSDTTSNKFYMLDDGTIYPQYQVDGIRGALNLTNYFKEGYTKDSVFTIDGKDFKLDDSGHLNVPEGTACVMENITRKK